jgi:hypothetical protein
VEKLAGKPVAGIDSGAMTPLRGLASRSDRPLPKRRSILTIRLLNSDGNPLESARAYLVSVGRRKKGPEQTLDEWERTEVVLDRSRESPDMNRYHVPGEVAWTY